MNKTKKIDGVRLLHGIAALSFIGIVGIFACCVESINEGGTGLTATLFFVVYVLLLLGCNTELIASEENFNGSPAKTCGLSKNLCQSEKEKLLVNNTTKQRPKMLDFGV